MPHPAVEKLLRFFEMDAPDWIGDGLAADDCIVDAAHKVAMTADGPEATVALRKLIEARDALHRAFFRG